MAVAINIDKCIKNGIDNVGITVKPIRKTLEHQMERESLVKGKDLHRFHQDIFITIFSKQIKLRQDCLTRTLINHNHK